MALDNFRTQKIIWDRANRKIFEAIEANSGDSNGRKLVVQVINQEVSENLSGTTLSLGWKSRNGAKGLDAFNVVDASKGIFEIYYTTEMLSNIGNIEASLILIDSTSRIESSTFTISVRPSTVDDESVESENSFTALTEALVKVNDLEDNYALRFNKVDEQLAQTIKQGEASVTDIDKNKGLLDQTYLSNTLIQQIAGTAPVNATPSPRSIVETQMAFPAIKGFFSKNLFDKSKAKANTAISSSTGEEYELTDFYSSDFIFITSGATYTKYSNQPYAWYDIDKAFISGSGTGQTLTAPTNASYIKITTKLADLNREQLELGDTATEYQPYGNIFDMELLKERIERKHLTFDPVGYVTGKNLFNKDTVTPDSHISYLNGNVVSLSGFTASDFIPVKPMTDYTMKHAQQMAFYNVDKSFISGLASPTTFTTPENAAFTRVTTSNGNLATQQIELGTVSTAYEPFTLYLDPKINVKSENVKNEDVAGGAQLYNNAVVCIGDSITRGQSDIRRYPTWLETVPGIGKVYNKGESGSGISYAIDNIDWVFDMNPLPKTAVILYGTNDTPLEASAIAQKMHDLIKLVVAKGVEPVLCTILPRADDLTRMPKVLAFNNWLRDYAKQNGYILADTFNTFANPDGSPKAGYLNADNLHPSSLGYRELVKTVEQVLPIPAPEQPWTVPNDGNIITNPTFTGDANADGVADGWTLSIPTGATATASLVDRPETGNWQQIQKNGGTDTTPLTSINQTITHTFVAGATYLLEVDIESDELTNADYNVNGQFRDAASAYLGGIGASPRIDVTTGKRRWRGYAVAPSGAESLKVFLAVYGQGSATVRFGRLMVRKIETFNIV